MIILYQDLVIQKSMDKPVISESRQFKVIQVAPVVGFRFLNVQMEAVK